MNPYAGNPNNYPATNDEPDDADIASPNAAVFNTSFEGLGDRTASLASGYRDELADLDALAAIDTTSVPTGAVRFVVGFGRFQLDKVAYPTFAEDRPLVVAPTVGTGRWFARDAAAILQYERIFTATGASSWKCPPNLAQALVEVVGGGGGGGGGASTSSSTDAAPGGGGGSQGGRFFGVIAPVGNASHDITVGDGGAGGVTISSGVDGALSKIQVHLGVVLATGQGGQGGGASIASAGALLIPSAPAAQGNGGPALAPLQVTGLTEWPIGPGDGAFTQNSANANAKPGGTSHQGFAGGAGGNKGADSSGQKGGGGGGGGGGGHADVGGAGGAGGAGNSSGAANDGTAGTAAPANSGAGGGGGGGAGAGSSGSKTGGTGGKGGSGYVIIRGRV